VADVFAGIAMSLNALVTSLLVAVAVTLFRHCRHGDLQKFLLGSRRAGEGMC
jgi:hypothetical protein